MDQYWNSYAYCGANPVNYTNPDGLRVIINEKDENSVRDFTFEHHEEYDRYGFKDNDVAWEEYEKAAADHRELPWNQVKSRAEEALENYNEIMALTSHDFSDRSTGFGQGQGQSGGTLPVAIGGSGEGSGIAQSRINEGLLYVNHYAAIFDEAAADNGISSSLLKAIYIRENGTAKHGFTGTGLLESSISFAYNIGNFGSDGSCGPFNLGPDARKYSKLFGFAGIIKSLSIKYAVPAAAAWLASERGYLIAAKINNPSAGMIATRYNDGDVNPGYISPGYGASVVNLMNTYFP